MTRSDVAARVAVLGQAGSSKGVLANRRGTIRPGRDDFLGPRPTRAPSSGVGRDVGQPWKRPACPSSVASRNVRTLYLASRRSRSSAAPQPPVNSQPTLTVSSRSRSSHVVSRKIRTDLGEFAFCRGKSQESRGFRENKCRRVCEQIEKFIEKGDVDRGIDLDKIDEEERGLIFK